MDTNTTVLDAATFNDELRKVLRPVTVYVGIEAAIGFFGNLIVLLVFKFRYHNCNFRYFVLCLALTDVIASCTAISGEVVTQLYWYVYPFPAICKVKSFFNVFTVFAEAYCLLLIAVDRYRKVCRPLGWQITPRIAIALCGVIYFVSTIIAIPVAIFWGTHDREVQRTDVMLDDYGFRDIVKVNVTICEIDQEYLGQNSPKLYTYCLETLISMSLLPMLCLYILVAKTLIGSSTALDKRQSSISRNNNRNKAKISERSDVEDKTDDDSNANSNSSQTVGSITVKVLPSKPSALKLNDIELDSSTVNSMTTTQTAESYSDSPRREKTSKQTKHPRRHRKVVSARVRRKTLIMFVLTLIFMVTTITYLTMLGLIAGDILETLSYPEKAVYFFFFRFYFINHVINPLVYGLLDPQFRKVIGDWYRYIRSVCCFCRKDVEDD